MKGLKTQENDRFQRFFTLIQNEAQKHNAIFYADAGDGHEYSTHDLECEDMMGWLIPINQADKFEAAWKETDSLDDWADYYKWAVWYLDGNTVRIRFEEN